MYMYIGCKQYRNQKLPLLPCFFSPFPHPILPSPPPPPQLQPPTPLSLSLLLSLYLCLSDLSLSLSPPLYLSLSLGSLSVSLSSSSSFFMPLLLSLLHLSPSLFLTLYITGVFSESMDIACTHVHVGTCLSLTYQFLRTM